MQLSRPPQLLVVDVERQSSVGPASPASGWPHLLSCKQTKAWQSDTPGFRTGDMKPSENSQKKSWRVARGDTPIDRTCCTGMREYFKILMCKVLMDFYMDFFLQKRYLKSFLTTGHCCENVVGVHGAKYKVPASPRFQAESANNSISCPALKTTHAYSSHVTGLPLTFHLWTKEKNLIISQSSFHSHNNNACSPQDKAWVPNQPWCMNLNVVLD